MSGLAETKEQTKSTLKKLSVFLVINLWDTILNLLGLLYCTQILS